MIMKKSEIWGPKPSTAKRFVIGASVGPGGGRGLPNTLTNWLGYLSVFRLPIDFCPTAWTLRAHRYFVWHSARVIGTLFDEANGQMNGVMRCGQWFLRVSVDNGQLGATEWRMASYDGRLLSASYSGSTIDY